MTELLSIAMLQADIGWESPEASRAKCSQLLEKVDEHMDVILLPETWATGFTMNASQFAEPSGGPSYRWMFETARRYNALVIGTVIISEEGKYFNRLLAVSPDGLLGRYDKHHLFTLAKEHETYTAGVKNVIVQWRGWRILPQVCYDLRFPVWSRRKLPVQEYDLLVYVANWPDARGHHWRRMLPARAIENQCYVAAVNRVGKDGNGHHHRGDSFLIDFHGEKLAALEPDVEGVVFGEISLDELKQYRSKFPFQADADTFNFV